MFVRQGVVVFGAVAAVDGAHSLVEVGGVEAGLDRGGVDHQGPAMGLGSVGARSVPGPAVVERAPARGRLDEGDAILMPGDRAPVVGRAVELHFGPEAGGPSVRAPDQFHGPRLGNNVVQGDPAGEHVDGREPPGVGVVAVEAQRPAGRRLPQDVVLDQAGPRPAAQPGQGLSHLRGQHRRGHRPVRLPGVAYLAGQRWVPRLALPVHLVGRRPGLEVAGEQGFEAGPQRLDHLRVDQPVGHHQEPVGGEPSHGSVVDQAHEPTAGRLRHLPANRTAAAASTNPTSRW